MSIHLRKGRDDEAGVLGAICYEAVRAISEKNDFPPDFPALEVGTELMLIALAA
ncbi:MAG: hypothetical protein ABIU09_07490 [Pyrinomonadaceae bacterium]